MECILDKNHVYTSATPNTLHFNARAHTNIGNFHGLSLQGNVSHHHEWDLLWTSSPMRERHIRWQIWHWKLLVYGGPDFRRSRFASNSRPCPALKSCIADLHMDRQSVLSLASVSSWEGVSFRQSYCTLRGWNEVYLAPRGVKICLFPILSTTAYTCP